MSGASKTNSPLVLYAEGVDPEADLVLVCGQRKFFVALKGLHESTTMALFHHLATMACENNVQAMDRKNNAFQR